MDSIQLGNPPFFAALLARFRVLMPSRFSSFAARSVSCSRRAFVENGPRGVFLAALILSCALARAQEAQSVATFHAQTKLVNVYAAVRDRNGKIVRNLKKDDFTVEEDGRPQKIGFFSRESDMPLLLGLLVDTSPSEERMLGEEREASSSFLRQVMNPKKDQAFLIHFDRKVELMQDLTPSLGKLEKALDRLEDVEDEPSLDRKREDRSQENFAQSSAADSQDSPDDKDSRRGGSGAGGGTTHLFDAVYLASSKVLKSQTGRKALIVIGDGDDMGSTVSKERAIRAAQQADVLIYCIRIVDKDFGKQPHRNRRFNFPVSVGIPGIGIPGMGGPGGPGGGGPGGGGSGPGEGGGGHGPGGGAPDRSEGKKNMEALAGQTGGALYEVTKKVSLGDIFAQIQEELRSLYSLGYTPEASALPGYRHIQVTVKSRGLKVQARDGYYADED